MNPQKPILRTSVDPTDNGVLERLASFFQWPATSIFTGTMLANAGFYFTNENDTVECQTYVDKQSTVVKRSDQQTLKRPNAESVNHSNADERSPYDNDKTMMVVNEFINSLSNEILTEVRIRTFSIWPKTKPSATDMISAGFFYTNISDRVICIHCDAMFHRWIQTDVPYEIHRLKSPNCYFIKTIENRTRKMNSNQNSSIVTRTTLNDNVIMRNNNIIINGIIANPSYTEICKRFNSFDNWPKDQVLPAISTFVGAGFFYTALENWQADDDPKIEHARWFPNCSYIREYLDNDLYQAVQRQHKEQQLQREQSKSQQQSTINTNTWSVEEIDRMVSARLDLPIVEKLRNEGYTISIINSLIIVYLIYSYMYFIEDDFKTDTDLRIACYVLNKQVQLINGNEDRIIVPQKRLKDSSETREQDQLEEEKQGIKTDNKQNDESAAQSTTSTIHTSRSPVLSEPKEIYPCVLCLTTERQVACLPCGHLICCVACGHSLRLCPVCRADVKAFVRIYT
ncbi:unnamed protein product [Didymodactylos carnosus]|uniref:RING-type domain-containing protein n=1 Tax=Didymodactylos carnosus TaxID=1234261 RepID=A0A8S2QVT5_9BILA|nr:unnamed protein product [Didymodactylos carnosus]CAF4123828.1 unnamed protein product [Didymodactylos carnosus]